MAGGFKGTWLGGRIYWKDLGGSRSGAGEKDGGSLPSGKKARKPSGPTYYIWKRIGGTKYRVSTRCSTERAALKELERFEAAPQNYQPGGEPPEPSSSPIYLDEKLTKAYLEWCRDIKSNDPIWLGQKQLYLAWWADQLSGVDLRKATLRGQIEPPLGPELRPTDDGYSTRGKRIAVIKALYSYLRAEKHARDAGFGITVVEDPVFGALKVPQSNPAHRKVKDKAVSQDHILLAIEHLTGHWKHALTIQAGTSWHVTEVIRFAQNGSVEPYPSKGADKSVAGVLVCPRTKRGGELRTGVSREVLAAGKALLERGSLSRKKYEAAVVAACKAAKIPTFKPGRIRASAATFAVNAGADTAAVSTWMHHSAKRTTERFYATHAVAKKPPTMI